MIHLIGNYDYSYYELSYDVWNFYWCVLEEYVCIISAGIYVDYIT
jgi:hypothetical protein